MTVGELINWLEDFNKDTEVVIGQRQQYGSDFAYEILDATEQIYEGFWGGASKVVSINLWEQIGTIDYDADPYDYDDENEDEDDEE